MTDLPELNPILGRRLRDNNWILLTSKAEPIVVDEATSEKLMNGDIRTFVNNKHFMSVLESMGFLKDSSESITLPITERKSAGWIMARITVLMAGILSLPFIGYVSMINGIPTGNQLLAKHAGLLSNIIFIIMFSIVTTIIHEFMHLLFGQSNFLGKTLHISAKRAVAKVSLSHVWVWSRLGRTTAIAAGVALDLVELAVLSELWLYSNIWIFPVACSILWVRILWQFRIHRRTDGQLIIAMISDNPSMLEDLKNKRTIGNVLINVLGRVASATIAFGWLIPLIFRTFEMMN